MRIDSPCIDAGDPKSEIDLDGTRADLGAFPFNHNQTKLEISPMNFDFGPELKMKNLTIKAYGGKPVHYQAQRYNYLRSYNL